MSADGQTGAGRHSPVQGLALQQVSLCSSGPEESLCSSTWGHRSWADMVDEADVDEDAGATSKTLRSIDQDACRQYMRELLMSEFRGREGKGLDRPDRLSLQQRTALYENGQLDQKDAWGVRPQPDSPHFQRWETRAMLDAAGVLVRAVYLTMPEVMHKLKLTWRPVKRYVEVQRRLHALCSLFRSRYKSRCEDEPLHKYLSHPIVVLGVQQLLSEIRWRTHDFVPPKSRNDPMLEVDLKEWDYKGWERSAIDYVHCMLDAEKEILAQNPAQ